MKRAVIFFAEGFEEVEALTVVDLLRRAKVQPDMVSITGSLQVTGSHGIQVQADVLFADARISEADALVLPGGMPGTRNLQAYAPLIEALQQANEAGKLLGILRLFNHDFRGGHVYRLYDDQSSEWRWRRKNDGLWKK